MKLTTYQLTLIGTICFLIGFLLILLSWYFSYPIYFSEIQKPTFFQFYPTIWPGIVLSLIGLFILGYFSKTKFVKFLCISIIPPIYYSYVYYFQYVPTSDGGNVRAMYEIFHMVGANSAIEPYFQYPTFFNLNEVCSVVLGTNEYLIALFFFALYGILISMLLLTRVK